MNRELLLLVDALAREKNVPKEIVFSALEAALAMRVTARVRIIALSRPRGRVRPVARLGAPAPWPSSTRSPEEDCWNARPFI